MAALAKIENIVIEGVPAGGEDNFITLRTHGEIPTFDFEPRDHLELGELLGRDRHGARHEGVGQPLLLPQGHRCSARVRADDRSPSTGRCRPGSSR